MFGIGIYHPQIELNVGTLFRSAYAFSANFVYTIEQKYKRQASDTCDTTRWIPYYNFTSFDEFRCSILMKNKKLVIIELENRAQELNYYQHPENCAYLLGNEGGGIPLSVINNEKYDVVQMSTKTCLNVSMAGTVVIYDRLLKEKIC